MQIELVRISLPRRSRIYGRQAEYTHIAIMYRVCTASREVPLRSIKVASLHFAALPAHSRGRLASREAVQTRCGQKHR